MAMLGSGEISPRATQPWGREMLNSLTGSWTVMKLPALAEGEVSEAVGFGLPAARLGSPPPRIAEAATPMVARMTTARMRMPTRWATLTGPPGGLKKLLTNPLVAGEGGGEGAAAFGFGLGAGEGAGIGASVARAAGTEAATAAAAAGA